MARRYVDVDLLKQQDFQDYSNTDVEYAIDHCPTADVVSLDDAIIVGLQVALDVVREYRRRTGGDPVFDFSQSGANKIANYILNLFGRESIFGEGV
jgi:hypothetical protein